MSFELERGSTLGRYELLVRIGRGGMASVWVARGKPNAGQPETLVAVKAMLPELVNNAEFRSMFLDEGQIVGAITHPNVVRVHEVGETKGVLYMAMEWVEGDSLHTLIAEANKRRPIPPEVAVRLIADTASGLHAAHEIRGWDGKLKHIVHCDVSPHNILIGLNGVVKLVDFGVAGAMNQLSSPEEVKIRGKFGYMSPEQAQAKVLDRRSDIFSLGIVLFELTTGYRLFRGRDDRHTLELVQWGKVPKPSQVLPGYPEKLEAIVLKALEHDLEKRFQTADEFRDALETYLVEERILVPAAGVKGVLKRVLGSKIDQRRQQIRAAIRAQDGSVPNVLELVSNEPVTSDEDVISVSVPSEPSSDRSSSSSPDLGAAFLPGDGSSGVQTLSQRSIPPQSSSKWVLLGAALGVGISGAAVIFLNRHDSAPTVHELPRSGAAPPSAAAPALSPGPQQGNSGTGAFTLDNLPQEALPGAVPARGRAAPAASASPPGAHAVPLAEDVAALKTEPPPDTKSASGSQSRVDQIANSVSLDDPGGEAPGAFDKSAAQASLTRAAGMVGMCQRPGAPSGSGKVLVTFGPSGSVQGATVQGSLAGTPTGDCVSRQFRSAKVPPFSGAPVTVSKSFTVPE